MLNFFKKVYKLKSIQCDGNKQADNKPIFDVKRVIHFSTSVHKSRVDPKYGMGNFNLIQVEKWKGDICVVYIYISIYFLRVFIFFIRSFIHKNVHIP